MIDSPVDLAENPPVDSFAAQGGGADATKFPTLSRSLARRAQDPHALALQERRMADTEHIADRRFAVDAQRLELQKISHLTELQKEEAQIRQGMETQRQHQTALKGLLAIKPGDDPVAASMQIIADNPEVAKNPAIMDIIRSHVATQKAQQDYVAGLQHQADIKSRESGIEVPIDPVSGRPNFTEHSALVAAAAKQKDAEAASAAGTKAGAMASARLKATAAAKSEPVLDTPEQFRKDLADARKRNGIGFDTKTGKPTKAVFPDAVLQKHFDDRKSALDAGKPMTLGAAPAAVTSDPASIPDDHAAFLRANPDKAASFDAKYGAGSSAKILGQ